MFTVVLLNSAFAGLPCNAFGDCVVSRPTFENRPVLLYGDKVENYEQVLFH